MSEYITQKMVLETEAKLEKPEKHCAKDSAEKCGQQNADVSVPIELRPKATLGDIEMECCGEPEVRCREDKHKDVCEVIVTQKVSLKIPIRYQICATLGESILKCDCRDK